MVNELLMVITVTFYIFLYAFYFDCKYIKYLILPPPISYVIKHVLGMANVFNRYKEDLALYKI